MGRKSKKAARGQRELFPEVPYAFERQMYDQFGVVAGVDEVGRGCLAGPVVAAAVILPLDFLRPEFRRDHGLEEITDSKLLTAQKREELDLKIRAVALSFRIGMGEVEEIDTINILQASLLAMRRAVEALDVRPAVLLVDGTERIPRMTLPQRTIVGGDSRCRVIGAASIIAKVYRDQWMARADERYPGYQFSSHKGYGSPIHKSAIQKLGPSPLHRRTFSGVREYLERGV